MTTHRERRAVLTMYVGLALTIAAMIVPFASTTVLADHILAGYPDYAPARVDSAVTTYLVSLSVIGALGVGCWLWTVRAVNAGRRWARWAATVMFVLGTSVALTALTIRDTSGDTGLPPLHGWIGMLPCLAGLVAVTLLWRQRGVAQRRPVSNA